MKNLFSDELEALRYKLREYLKQHDNSKYCRLIDKHKTYIHNAIHRGNVENMYKIYIQLEIKKGESDQ